MSYPLGPVPYSLAIADGMPAKTEKSFFCIILRLAFSASTNEQVAHGTDGNASLNVLSPIPDNFEGVAEMVFHYLAKSSRVDFVTDTFKENSNKSFGNV